MGEIENVLNISHEKLVATAVSIAKSMGYVDIKTEYSITINNKLFIVDVFGVNSEGKTIGIECGNITNDMYEKLIPYYFFFDTVIWLPYITTKLPQTNDIINKVIESRIHEVIDLKITKEALEQEVLFLIKQREKLESILSAINPAIYKHVNELYTESYTDLKKIHKELIRDSERLNHYANIIYCNLDKKDIIKPSTDDELVLSRKIHLGR